MDKKKTLPLRYILAFCTFVLTLLLYIDRACISTAKNDICADLGLSLTQYGWVMAVFTLGYALFQTPTGRLTDRRGPRGVLASIVAIWSVLTALTGAVWNYVSMLVVRFLFGAGEAGAFPALAKVSFNWFPVKERGTIQGINFSGGRIGAAFAMPVVAILLGAIGWRRTFLLCGVLGLCYAFLWYLLFRNRPEESKRISSKEREEIVGGREKSASAAKRDLSSKDLLRSGSVWKTSIQYVCSNFTFYFALTWMFPYIQERFALDAVHAGLYASIPLIAGAGANWIGGISVDAIYRTGRKRLSRSVPAMVGFALSAIGMVMVTKVSSVAPAVFFMALAVFGADLTLPPSWSFCIDIGKENSGVVSGTMNMAGNLGAFVTIIAFPYLLDWTGSYVPFFYICAALSVAAICIWASMNPVKTLYGTYDNIQ